MSSHPQPVQSTEGYVAPSQRIEAQSARILEVLDQAANGKLTIEQKIQTVESLLNDAKLQQAKSLSPHQEQLFRQLQATATSLPQQQSLLTCSSNALMLSSTSSALLPSLQHRPSFPYHSFTLQPHSQTNLVFQQQCQLPIVRQASLQSYPLLTMEQRFNSSPTAALILPSTPESHTDKKMKLNHDSSPSGASKVMANQKKKTRTASAAPLSIPSPICASTLPATWIPLPATTCATFNAFTVPSAAINANAPSESESSSSAQRRYISASKREKQNGKTSTSNKSSVSFGFASPWIKDRKLSSRAFSKICFQNFQTLNIFKKYSTDFKSKASKAAVKQSLHWLMTQLEADEKKTMMDYLNTLAEDGSVKAASSIARKVSVANKAGVLPQPLAANQQMRNTKIEDHSPARSDSTDPSPPNTSSSSSSASSLNSTWSSMPPLASSQEQSVPHEARLIEVDNLSLPPDCTMGDDSGGLARWKVTVINPPDLKCALPVPSHPPSPMDRSVDTTCGHDEVSTKHGHDDDISSPLLHSIVEVNRAWERLTGFTQEFMMNLPIGERPFKFLRSDFVPAAHRLMLFAQMNKISMQMKQYVVMVNKDGEELYCLEAWKMSFDEHGMLLSLSSTITPLPTSQPVPPFVPGREMDEACLINGSIRCLQNYQLMEANQNWK